MDSITHTVLGACLGEAIAGKQLGKKAMLIGILANNLPDIDVVTALWTAPAQELLVHRGITHSILFAVIVSPLLAYVFYKLVKSTPAPYLRWLYLVGSGMLLHILMDAFTSYGTGWFEPFSHYRVTFNTLFIADPLFALPLLTGTLILLILRRSAFSKRKLAARSVLGISLCYLLISIGIKLSVNSLIKKDLARKQIPYEDFMATPTPLNNVLWYAVVKSQGNFYVGYYSILDSKKTIRWEYFTRNDSLLQPLNDKPEIALLRRFSKNYYCVGKTDSLLVFNDMRFGQVGGWHIPQAPFVFRFELQKKAGRLDLQQGRFRSFNSKDMDALFERIKGN